MTDPGSSDPGSGLDAFTDADGGLVFWHPVDDAPIDESFLPWGQVAAGSSADTRVRVRNTSDDYTARDILVALGGPGDPDAGDASTDHLVSVDGDTFAATVNAGDLAPGQISAPVTLRRVTPPDAAAGPAGFTLTATATSWAPATAATGDDTPAGDTGDQYDPDAAQVVYEDPEEQM